MTALASISAPYINMLTETSNQTPHSYTVINVLLVTVAILALFGLQELNRLKYNHPAGVMAVLYRSITTIALFVAVMVWLKSETLLIGLFYMIALIVYFEPIIKPYGD